MITGNSYRFRYAAVNSLGTSDYSNIRTVGLGALPAPVTGLARSSEGNNATAIGIEWSDLTSEDLITQYYSLYIDDGKGVHFTKTYQGACSDTIIANLTSSIYYSFYVVGTNFDGDGTQSSTLKLRSCVEPSGVIAPSYISSTETSVTLRWT